MTELKLKVGTKYMTRSGMHIVIKSALSEDTHAYQMGYRFVGGPCGQYYTEEGKTYVNDPDKNPGDLILDFSIHEHQVVERIFSNVTMGKLNRPEEFSELTEVMCLMVLGGLAGESFTKLDADRNGVVLLKHAVTAIQAAFNSGRQKSPSQELKIVDKYIADLNRSRGGFGNTLPVGGGYELSLLLKLKEEFENIKKE